MENNIASLAKALSANDTTLLSSTLNTIISSSQQASNFELNECAALTFADILTKSSNDEIRRLSANAIGELAKTETNRNKLSRKEIVLPLIEFCKSSNLEIQKQTCRAIGNLCYENDSIRSLFGKTSVENIVKIIKNTLQTVQSNDNMLLVSCGCLMNLINGNDELQEATLNQPDVLNTIERIIRTQLAQFDRNEACISHILIILNMIIEYMAADDWLSEGLNCILVDILRVSVNPEISGVCLEILQAQSENDTIKLTLAKYGTCQLIHQLVETHKHRIAPNSNDSSNTEQLSPSIDSHNRTILKLACDLIILILNGDSAMELLYSDGTGEVYRQMLQWLDDPDVDIVCAGVVALGNFARDDNKCVKMVEDDKVGVKLLKKLSECSELTEDDNENMTKVIFALLSALRNLSIPAVNKAKLLKENLIGILLDLVNTSELVDPVIFKLLGTLRMVIDGQEKTSEFLLTQHCFIQKLVQWCRNSEHLGVRGEAPRLLAWLIKNNSRSQQPQQINNLITEIPDVIPCLVEMLGSMHPVMQNEAILALVLLCASCLNGDSSSSSVLEASSSNSRNQTDEEKIKAMSTSSTETVTKMVEKMAVATETENSPCESSFEQHLITSKLPSAIHDIIQRRHHDLAPTSTNSNVAFLGNVVSLLEQLIRSSTLRRCFVISDTKITEALQELLESLSTSGESTAATLDTVERAKEIVATLTRETAISDD